VSRTTRLVLLAIGAAVVALMIWKAGPATLWAGLRSSLWVVAALIPLWATVYLLNAVAWRMLTSKGGAAISLPRSLLMTVVAFGVNYSTPFLSFGGEPLKVIAATKALGRSRAVGSIVAYRLLHALAHMVLFLAALLPAAILLPHTPLVLGLILGVGVVLVVITVFLLSRHREGMALHALQLLQRLPLLKRLAVRLEPHTAVLHEIDTHGTAIYKSNPRRFYGALGVEVVARALSLAEYWVILYGLGLGTDPLRAFVVASFSSLVVNALIFVPFELGTKEGGLFLIAGWLGIDPSLGVAAALLSRIRELTWIAIGWGLVWTVE
jgi:uncharacterized protein (TIRG00374 family)